ncbi:carbon storage regulator [Bythopirellula polymerisocia]|uniref:Translational regulator CsrA n=1 Tax=Bythopirellula polymerisocia TaxID=2528003 RepID=A0A5C6D5N7_9BACT|nr:carbon storage regulator [Bythopirellula polymerisocia]TWU30536.1 hypothetical protein Pla144_13240 [Bythopirellula polymerisocia]
MLVLGRKEEQTIQIGNDIRVTILRIKGNSVSVGIEAPEQVLILRDELAPTARAWEAETDLGSQPQAMALAICK